MSEVKYPAEQLISMIGQLCVHYRECCVNLERREEGIVIRRELEAVCCIALEKMQISQPGLLVALLDAYEVTRDEEMLQEVLYMVSRNLDQLETSVESVKLLTYCYYYVDEEECVEMAWAMLERLRQEGGSKDGLAEAERVLEELT